METSFAKAWREWQDSPEGRRALDSTGIEVPQRLHKYFVNRIDLAFAAGWNAMDQRERTLVDLLKRVEQWDPAFPVEASLLDEIRDAIGRSEFSAGAPPP